MTSAAVPAFDKAALLAKLREGDPVAEAQVLRETFGSTMGRFALALILARAGVGDRRGPNLTPDERAYADGKADGALDIMTSAGFDAPSAVIMVMTDEPLEGQDHERPADASDHADAHPQLD